MRILPQKEKLYSVILLFFLIFSFFFPAYTAEAGDSYSPEIIYANIIAVIFITFSLVNFRIKCENFKFIVLLFVVNCVYFIVSFWYNYYYHNWYYEQINVFISVSFLLSLMAFNDTYFTSEEFVHFIFICVAIISIFSILGFFMGYSHVRIENRQIIFRMQEIGKFGEKRFSWFCFHKSQYGVLCILFLSFVIRFRSYFSCILLYYSEIFIIMASLFLSHSYTSFFGAILVILCSLLDYYRNIFLKNKKYLYIVLVAFIVVGLIGFNYISKKRDVVTLGYRIPIWLASIREILTHPNGIGNQLNYTLIYVSETFAVNNCHNVFLNEMLRYSIGSGLLYTLMFFLIMMQCIRKKISIFSIGVWIAVMISLCMDYSLLANDLSEIMLFIYFIFFANIRSKEPLKFV